MFGVEAVKQTALIKTHMLTHKPLLKSLSCFIIQSKKLALKAVAQITLLAKAAFIMDAIFKFNAKLL